MTKITVTLVLQIKATEINDMAKVSIKSEKITAFGEMFFNLDIFDSILSSMTDTHSSLMLRSKPFDHIGYVEIGSCLVVLIED